jgi:hypothetical protein
MACIIGPRQLPTGLGTISYAFSLIFFVSSPPPLLLLEGLNTTVLGKPPACLQYPTGNNSAALQHGLN